MILIILLLLIFVIPFGGNYWNNGAYRSAGFGFGGILLVILVLLLLTHSTYIRL